MTEPPPPTESPSHSSRPEVVCAKCHAANPHGANTCGACGAHLYVSCHHCGHRNERHHLRCTSCGLRLHRTFWRRVRKKVFPDAGMVRPQHVVLLVVMVLAGFLLILLIVDRKLLF